MSLSNLQYYKIVAYFIKCNNFLTVVFKMLQKAKNVVVIVKQMCNGGQRIIWQREDWKTLLSVYTYNTCLIHRMGRKICMIYVCVCACAIWTIEIGVSEPCLFFLYMDVDQTDKSCAIVLWMYSFVYLLHRVI